MDQNMKSEEIQSMKLYNRKQRDTKNGCACDDGIPISTLSEYVPNSSRPLNTKNLFPLLDIGSRIRKNWYVPFEQEKRLWWLIVARYVSPLLSSKISKLIPSLDPSKVHPTRKFEKAPCDFIV